MVVNSLLGGRRHTIVQDRFPSVSCDVSVSRTASNEAYRGVFEAKDFIFLITLCFILACFLVIVIRQVAIPIVDEYEYVP